MINNEGLSPRDFFLGVRLHFYPHITRPFGTWDGRSIWCRDLVQLEEWLAHEIRAQELGHLVNRPWDLLPGVVIL